MKTHKYIFFVIYLFAWILLPAQKDSTLLLKKTISGNISPKSVVASSNGYVYAQNMMYKHTITVYDKHGNLVQTIYDTVYPAHYGYNDSAEVLKGAPVEATLNSNGSSLWVSNYCMHGIGYRNPGCDNCAGQNKFDKSYLYRINTATFQKTACMRSGSVPKYLLVSPNDKYLAVANWSDGTVGIYSTTTNELQKEIYVGAFPRGLAWSQTGNTLFVAVMGSTYVAQISVPDFNLKQKIEVGIHPRHICGPVGDSLLLVTLNGEANVAFVSLTTGKVKKIYTGSMPRSMSLSHDNEFAYVVNYGDNTLSKISVSKQKLIETTNTLKQPVGVTNNPVTGEIWVACYSGFIQLFTDNEYNSSTADRKTRISEVKLGIPFESISNAFTQLLVSSDKTSAENPTEPIQKAHSMNNSDKSSPQKTEHGYYLVAGAFRSNENAHRFKQKLAAVNEVAQLIPQNEKGLTYVAIGPFESKEDAAIQAEETSEKAGTKCWVYHYY